MRRVSVLSLSVAVPALLVAAPAIPAMPSPHPVTPGVQRIALSAPADQQASSARRATADERVDILTAETETDNFKAFGLTWSGDSAGVTVRVRLREQGQWTSWQSLGLADAYPDANSADARRADGQRATEPLVSRGADAFQVSMDAPASARLTGVEALLVDPGVSDGDAGVGRSPVGAAVAAPAAPTIVPRSEWGADENLRQTACPEGPTYSSTIKVGFVHHTAGTNEYTAEEVPSILRGIYAFHVQGRKWCDIGYNFLVDKFGRIFEGRFGGIDRAVVGAHTGGFNTDSFGVAAIGTFTSTALPGVAQQAVEDLLAWKLGMYWAHPHQTATLTSVGAENSRYTAGQSVTFRTISGHRDASFTECPGDQIYALLPSIGSRLTFPRVQFGTAGGQAADRPAAASWGPERMDVFTVGPDGGLRHTSSDGAPELVPPPAWAAWENLGGSALAGPAASTPGPGQVDVFVPGLDRALWHRRFDGGWSEWESVGGQTMSAPASVSWSAGRVDIFVRGIDNGLWHRFYDGSWSPWENLYGVLSSAPAAASAGEGKLDVVAAGADGQIWHRAVESGVGWAPWEPLGGQTRLAPGTAVVNGELTVLVTGLDRQIWHRSTRAGWTPLGGIALSGVGATARAGHTDAFVRGADNAVWYALILE